MLRNPENPAQTIISLGKLRLTPLKNKVEEIIFRLRSGREKDFYLGIKNFKQTE